jgi:CheY-like chemotaxis protein
LLIFNHKRTVARGDGVAGLNGNRACRPSFNLARASANARFGGANAQNFLQFVISHSILKRMTRPLALLLYEKLLPGSQLVNRLQDLKYRVQSVTDPAALVRCAEQEKPMLVLADLAANRGDVCGAIAELKRNPATQHIPVIAFAPENSAELEAAARQAGATLVVSDTAILTHLAPFLDQALQVE